ncbi:hypothetical protein HD553DRAFT_315708 [Filobasidium floriforme]|uniref:uncharacterized protein n=1 Tax=Filobasidium floriforme TaxID=5210 RepID=UPI001E8E4CA9|nr:uncharacterized protein HD553DRAFT_315708 [Filobasidium floriforme]KAH8081523.1 hypothetical protein HD553DRAFT_315708 [Filobasidium floriforme]
MSSNPVIIHGHDGYRDPAIIIGPFKPSRPGYGPVLSYLQAAQLQDPLIIHPLLNLQGWDKKPYAKYLAYNITEHPQFAAIWVDYDDTETEWIKERGQPATSPIVEELNLGHVETGWCVRVRNRMGITCEDVLFAIFDFFASPLYVDELGEMHPRAVRIMEQQFFEKRRLGFFDGGIEGYRKADALLGKVYFNGLYNDGYARQLLKKKYNFNASNLLLLELGTC